MSKFIVIDGPDGSGKSTIIPLLAEYLKANNEKVIVVKDASTTDLNLKIRQLVMETPDLDVTTEILLFFAMRNDLLKRAIEPALLNGTTVICDRWTDSTYAYQGVLNKKENVVCKLEDSLLLRQPDLTVYLDVSPEVSFSRIKARANENDRFDELDLDRKAAVRQAYHNRFAHCFNSADSVMVNSEQPIGAVLNDIAYHLAAYPPYED